jgi:hypothetical protein
MGGSDNLTIPQNVAEHAGRRQEAGSGHSNLVPAFPHTPPHFLDTHEKFCYSIANIDKGSEPDE